MLTIAENLQIIKNATDNIKRAIIDKGGIIGEDITTWADSIRAIRGGLRYLMFTAEEDNSTISLTSQTSPDIKYSLNGGEWTQWNYSAITLNTGDTVRMKGNNANGFSTGTSSYNRFVIMNGKIGASGNIMSLLYEDDFEGKLTIPCDFCYRNMFQGCTSLVTTPELPATTLADSCYLSMFKGCTSLTTAPELPATALAEGCYEYMFEGCTSLTTAPELPATTLALDCYYNMFKDCSALTTAPELPAITLIQQCYNGMFKGCTSLTTAPELPATTLSHGCYNGMFVGCTSLTTAPELPATTLASGCYQWMFSGCIKLNYIKMLATYISNSSCLDNWVEGVSSTGTFVKHLDMTTLPTGVSGIPEGWNVEDNVIEIDYKKFSIINNSNNNEIIFYYNDGIYSSVKENHIDLSDQYDENTIYSFTPEINLIINIYKVSQDNIGVLKSANVIWESATSLEELCNTYNINDLDGILIIIKSVDDNYNDGYGYYYNDYYDDYYNDY